jgi:tetratricopeptide (TPR) repeat protein
VTWLNRLGAEHDNLRAALAWSQADPAGAAAELRLAAALGRFWNLRGHISEGRAWLAHALERDAGATAARASALNWAGLLASLAADLPRAAALLEASVALGRGLPDQQGLPAALRHLALVARDGGNDGRALALCEEALAVARRVGERREVGWALIWTGLARCRLGDRAAGRRLVEAGLADCRARGDQAGLAQALSALGGLTLADGDHDHAGALLAEGLTQARAIATNGQPLVLPLVGLAEVARVRGDAAEAHARYREALASAREAGETRFVPWCLPGFGALAAAAGQDARAARLFGAAAALRQATGEWWVPLHAPRADHRATVAAVRARLGNLAFDAAWAAGQAMTLEQAVADALEDAPVPG